jgi:hypothetical protein
MRPAVARFRSRLTSPVAPITRIFCCVVLLFFGICYLEESFVSKVMSVLEAVATVVLGRM